MSASGGIQEVERLNLNGENATPVIQPRRLLCYPIYSTVTG